MTKYQQYEEYKDFDSVFLNEIPASWEVKPLYTLCEFRQGKAHEPFIDDDGEFICVSARFVSTQGKSFKRCKVNLTPAKLNDILMVMSDLPNGRALARAFFIDDKIKYAVNQRVGVVTAKKVHAKFLYYQLNRNAYFLMFDDGSNQTNLSNDAFNKYPVLFPSDFEQKQIANFLDYETAQIDTLIDKQQTLIQLLKEKRQAVISHAVTKGLNPDAPMKDSGVEWLGEVPEHWELPKLIHQTSKIGDGLHSTPQYQDGTGYYFVNGNNLVSGQIVVSTTSKEVPEDEYKKHYIYLDNSSVLLSINGTIGNVARYNNEMVILGKSAAYMNCADSLLPEYLMVLLQSSQAHYYFDLEVTGTTIYNLSLNSIRQMRVCIPPKQEQSKIHKFCELQQNKYDTLIEKASTAIRLMQERRTALISAAVTGKIDVRGWRASE